MFFAFKKLISITLSLILLILLACPAFANTEPSPKQILASMSSEEKIAQMLMPAFRYYNGIGVTTLSSKTERIIEKHGFGGIILFSQNNETTAQTVELIDEMQKANSKEGRPQLFISVDQEGAGVTRLASGTQGPGNMALAATGDSQNAFDIGAIIGSELNAIGYNVDFAPVVDINSNPSNPVIGVRSFSDSAELTSEFASSFMKGLQSENIITALKHFPGHGDASTDSHTGLPRIEKSYDDLKSNELIPFARCIADGADMIMTAHIQYPEIEKTTYTSIKDGAEIQLPATLSKRIITEILRKDLAFDGVVVTDAMNMAAIAEHFDPLDSAALAINAGLDIILMPIDTGTDAGIDALDEYITSVAALLDSGIISAENVNSSVLRILKLKQKRNLLCEYNVKDISSKKQSAQNIVGSQANHAKEWEIAQKSITLVKNDNDALPITNADKTVVLVPYANEVNSAEYAVELLKGDGLVENDSNISVVLTTGKSAEEMKDAVRGTANVIAITEQYSQAGLAAAQYSKFDEVADFVHENGGKIIFISCNLPYDVARLQSGDAILLAYSAKGMNSKPDFASDSVATYGVSIPAGIYTAFNPDANLGSLPVNIPLLDENYKYTDEYLYERGFSIQYKQSTPVEPDEPNDPIVDNLCPLDGKDHGNTLLGKIIKLLHSFIYVFAQLLNGEC